jgi:hypothetical protein
MNDDGYTVAEVLAALVMIGLAIGGLTMGVRVIGQIQISAVRAAAADTAMRGVQDGLTGLLADQGPFTIKDPDAFVGSGRGFSFRCIRPSPCGAQLSAAGGGLDLILQTGSRASQTLILPGTTAAHFAYASERGVSLFWPPKTDSAQTLRSVTLVRDQAGGAPIASARIWREQPADCAFDPVSGDCRVPAQ